MTDWFDVPIVATGDWIDAAFINQYWGDNFRAIFQGLAHAGSIPIAIDANTIGETSLSAIMQLVYPVGSFYLSTISTDPATVLGFGTWEAVAGRMLIGAGTSDATYAAGATGGESQHTLTIPEMPAHEHIYHEMNNPSARWANGTGDYGAKSSDPLAASSTGTTGGGSAHNNMPPYLVIYIWKRTA